ncbi:MAG: hypothetical protein Q4A56_01740 [Porphyromonadaceae bacterium]|nr:hypothetical protein [Porphyromonadaceae bacterium]
MGIIEIISLILNILFGGGLWLSLVQIKQIREQKDEEIRRLKVDTKQVVVDIERTEIQNIENLARMWREQAELLERKLDAMQTKIDKLEGDLLKMNKLNNKIYKLLDKVSRENWEQLVEQVKDELKPNLNNN